MSLQDVASFTHAVAANPALFSEVAAATIGVPATEAAIALSALAKREGFEFTPEEATETRNSALEELSDTELDDVSGGLTSVHIMHSTSSSSYNPALGQQISTAAGGLIGQGVPLGGVFGAGVSAGVMTALNGGSAQQSVATGAIAAGQSYNDTSSTIHNIITGW